MKYIKHILLAIAVAIVAGIVTYIILKGQADAYMRAIPADAKAVGKIDINQFTRDAKLTTVEQLQVLKAWFKSDDVADIGIDMERPFYAFVSRTGSFGIVASVHNQDDLADCLEDWCEEGMCTPIIRQRGYSWTTISSAFLLAFDGHKAMVMGPTTEDQEDLQAEMLRLLEQNGNESAIQQPLFKELRSTTAPVACVMNFDMVPLSIRSMVGSYLKVHNSNDLNLRLTLNAVENEIVFNATFLTEKQEVRQQFDNINRTFRKIDGEFLEKTVQNHNAWACFNCDGSTLLKFLRLNDSVRMALLTLNVVLNADDAIRAIDGDVMLNVADSDELSALVVAKIAQHDFLDDVNNWIMNSKGVLHHIEGDTYAMNVGHDYLTFGIKDNYLYFHTPQPHPQVLRDDMFGHGNAYLLAERKSVKGSRFFATFDINAILELDRQQGGIYEAMPFLKELRRFDIVMEKADKWELRLIADERVDISKNILLRK